MAYIGLAVGLGARLGIIRRIEKTLRDKGAISKKTRVTPEEAGISSRAELNLLNFMIERGRVETAEDGKIWLKRQRRQ